MILYLDYSALQSNTGPCAAAHAAVRLAGYNVDIVFGDRRLKGVARATNQLDLVPPVLVTDDDGIFTSLAEIMEFTRAHPGRSRESVPEVDEARLVQAG